jgi:NADH-quinone oxidoreductase subunit J
MILLIVYVGAVAVLFLFVVMMLDVGDDKQTKHLALGYTRMAAFVAMLFGAELVVVALTWWSFPKAEDFIAHPQPLKTHNAQALGEILYTHYFYIFQLAGLILLVAMVGAIVLCFAPGIKRNLKKQSSQKQLNRTKASSLHLVDGEFRKGVTPCS